MKVLRNVLEFIVVFTGCHIVYLLSLAAGIEFNTCMEVINLMVAQVGLGTLFIMIYKKSQLPSTIIVIDKSLNNDGKPSSESPM